MKRVIDQFVILLYCFGAIIITDIEFTFIIAFLTAVIYAGCSYFGNSKIFNLVLSLLYIPLFIFFPEFLLFLPVILYGTLQYKNTAVLMILSIIAIWKLASISLSLFLFVLLGCGTALLLLYQTEAYRKLETKFKKTRDDTTELNLLLKEKNQALLQKQDYEIYTATLKERNRIAREIHDNVGHMLSRSILMTGAMKMINNDPALNESLIQLEETLGTAMSNVRESVHDLHDDSINLRDVLEELTKSFSYCKVHMDYDMGYEIPRKIKYSFITIVKEALNNIIRHSNATQANLIIREHPALYQLVIEDNGTLVKNDKESSGLGLINMKDRVASLEGTIQIRKENGFRIFITVPKKGEI